MLVLIGLLTLVLYTIYYLLTKNYGYWKKYNIPHLKPSLIVGNYGDFALMKKNMGECVEDICKMFPNAPLIGAYYGTTPALIVTDPEIIKQVVTKDFYYFNSRDVNDFTDREPATKNIFSGSGDSWKVVRQNLTPVFSSAKMKNMFYLIQKCNDTLEKFLERETNISHVQEARGLIARYTMDCISTCVFGVNSNAMGTDPNNAFRVIADKMFDSSYLQAMRINARSFYPALFYGLGFRAFSAEINDFFKTLMTKVFDDRNNKPGNRHDFVDFILGFNDKGYISGDSVKASKFKSGTEDNKVQLKVDNDLLIAQCFIFFGAGFDTSAGIASFALFELAKNLHCQDQVIEEVDAYLQKTNNIVTYECTTDLPYLEACVDETIRMYPILSAVTREVVEDYTFPSGVKVEKGMKVHIPVKYLHSKPEYFPEPDQFKPERFLGKNKDNIIPYTYMPFGEGPRVCIGMRFAKMQMMAGLVTTFKSYRIELAEGMSKTVSYEPKSLTTQTTHGIILKFTPRKKSQ